MNAIATASHQPEIQAVLDLYAKTDPVPVARATAALHVLLHDLYREPDAAIAWQTSTLTGDGFPLEFAVTSSDADLRYTTEISTPLVAPVQRLALAQQRLRQLTPAEIPAAVLARLQQVQQGGELRYGTWVGGRHGLRGDSYKLYVEVPAADLATFHTPLAECQIPYPTLADRPVRLRMLGYNLTSRRLEAYFRVPQVESYHVPRLMQLCGAGDRASELWDFIEASYGYSLRGKLPGGSVGFSYSVAPDGLSPIFTLFLFARALWGGDARIRRQFSALAAQQGWDITPYHQLTQPLALRHTWATDHGLLGVGVAATGSIALSLGIRPGGTGDAG